MPKQLYSVSDIRWLKKLETLIVFSLVTQMADRSLTSTGLSVYVYGGLHEVHTLPATVLLAKTNSVKFWILN